MTDPPGPLPGRGSVQATDAGDAPAGAAEPSLVSGAAELVSTVAALFPVSVGTALGPVDDEPPCPFPAERAVVATATAARRREFLAGRRCAHAALRAIGRDEGLAVGRGVMREPLWPAGVAGSISHAGGLAGAVAARTADAWGLGLDIELLEPPLDAALERIVMGPGGLPRTARAHPLEPYRSKIAFSVKECVHKCLFPRTRWALDFHDVAVDVDLDATVYEAVVDEGFRLAGRALPPLEGRFAVVGGYVLAGLWVGPGAPGHALTG